MAVKNVLLTVAEFARLPQPPGGVRQELHHGELVEMPPVKKIHTQIQKRLVDLLQAVLNPSECGVDKELPFRPTAEYEVWIADVALFSLKLWAQTPDDDYYRGVPVIVIEVLSPANTTSEMLARQEVCLRHGGQEFWIVDPQRQSVNVVRADGQFVVYHASGVIESGVLSGPINVSKIFS